MGTYLFISQTIRNTAALVGASVLLCAAPSLASGFDDLLCPKNASYMDRHIDVVQSFAGLTGKKSDCPSCEAKARASAQPELPKWLTKDFQFSSSSKDPTLELKRQTFPKACVEASLSNSPNPYRGGTSYVSCDPSEAKGFRAFSTTVKDKRGRAELLPKPCHSEKYVDYVYESYLQAMHCTGTSPQDFFGVINHESHFEVNARSYLGSLGISQLTGIAIKHVNENMHDEYQALLSKKECASIAPFLQEGIRPGNVCDGVGLPKNPATNLVYGVMVYREMERFASRALKGRFASMPERDRSAVKRMLIYMAYNGGIGGVQGLFNVFARNNPQLASAKAFQNEFTAYVRQHYGESSKNCKSPAGSKGQKLCEAKKKEVAGYISLNVREREVVRKITGNQKCATEDSLF